MPKLDPDGRLGRQVGQHLGSIGRGLFCLGPGLAGRSACQQRMLLESLDPCNEGRYSPERCLEECQRRVDRVPRPTYQIGRWWIARNTFRVVFGR